MMGIYALSPLLGLVCALGLPLLLLGGVYAATRALKPWGGRLQGDSARALLDRRLAEGSIDIDEYYERESALRSTEALPTRRR